MNPAQTPKRKVDPMTQMSCSFVQVEGVEGTMTRKGIYQAKEKPNTHCDYGTQGTLQEIPCKKQRGSERNESTECKMIRPRHRREMQANLLQTNRVQQRKQAGGHQAGSPIEAKTAKRSRIQASIQRSNQLGKKGKIRERDYKSRGKIIQGIRHSNALSRSQNEKKQPDNPAVCIQEASGKQMKRSAITPMPRYPGQPAGTSLSLFFG